ncbi:MAG: hypothetical protein ACXW0T_11760 [Methylobacter sp.]
MRDRSYAPAGRRRTRQQARELSIMAAVTHQGKTSWMGIGEAFNADQLIDFLVPLIKGTGRKVLLTIDK